VSHERSRLRAELLTPCSQLMFRRNISPPSSVSNKPGNIPASLPPAFTLVFFSAYSTLKMEAICSLETSVELHEVICQNIELFITTAVRTSNSTISLLSSTHTPQFYTKRDEIRAGFLHAGYCGTASFMPLFLYPSMTSYRERKLTVQRGSWNLIPSASPSCESDLKPDVSYFQV
jgi:hypothetical protein